MTERQTLDRKWSDAWCDAYRRRAGRYGHTMPSDQQRRMNYAYARMMKAEKRYLPHSYP